MSSEQVDAEPVVQEESLPGTENPEENEENVAIQEDEPDKTNEDESKTNAELPETIEGGDQTSPAVDQELDVSTNQEIEEEVKEEEVLDEPEVIGDVAEVKTTVAAGDETSVAAGDKTPVAAGDETSVAAGDETSVTAGDETSPIDKSKTTFQEEGGKPQDIENLSEDKREASHVNIQEDGHSTKIEVTKQASVTAELKRGDEKEVDKQPPDEADEASEDSIGIPSLVEEESEKSEESLITQAGSYQSSLESMSSSSESSEDESLPRNFQEYIQKYSQLFARTSVLNQQSVCEDESGKAFLKIDVNELVTGYKKDDNLSKDSLRVLSGLTRIKENLVCFENESIIFRSDYKQYNGVRILSGGHMGSEPLYTEYVGRGLLTGVVLGTASDPPSVATTTKALKELIKDSQGLLIIIQNNVEYRLIFGLAMERIRMEGFQNVDMISLGDDCFERCKSPVGRRGLGGIVLLYKLAGSMSEYNKSLREIYIAVRLASKSLVTISCMTKPFKAIGTGLDKNSKDGINFTGTTCQMIQNMLDYCMNPIRYFSMRIEPEDQLIVLVNYYRSKSSELYVIVDYILEELERRKVNVEAVYADNFVTGFWPGFSISLLLDGNKYRFNFLNKPCSSSIWPKIISNGGKKISTFPQELKSFFPETGPILNHSQTRSVKLALETACKAIILCENVLNTMHFFGNYGTKLRIGAEAVMNKVKQNELKFERPFNLLIGISEVLTEKLPGVMGAMYGCLFEGAARSFIRDPLTTVTSQNWTEAMDEALKTLRAYTNAKGGIVSLALSLIPVVTALHGPFINLIPKSNKNPILTALDSLRDEIEDRMKQSANEKESILKNQLDVESYALIIWLHAIYTSIYWKLPSSKSESLTDSKMQSKKSESLTSKQIESKMDQQSGENVSQISKEIKLLKMTLSNQARPSVGKISKISSDKSSKTSNNVKDNASRLSEQQKSIESHIVNPDNFQINKSLDFMKSAEKLNESRTSSQISKRKSSRISNKQSIIMS